MSVESFVDSLPEPHDLHLWRERATLFVRGGNVDRPLVLLTSGGTAVPLEHNAVRYLDNFSRGLRGANCCEEFLRLGCDVMFLHRTGSLRPYRRLLQPTFSSFQRSADLDTEQVMWVSTQLRSYGSSLLEVPFATLADYVHLLQTLACAVRQEVSPERNVLVVLAAAVSDFYLPASEMSVHKIQSDQAESGLSGLTLILKPVPKLIGTLRENWLPTSAFIVTFKLETDEGVLLEKARTALRRYGHELVVANLLSTRDTAAQILHRSGQIVNLKLDASEALNNAIVERILAFATESATSS